MSFKPILSILIFSFTVLAARAEFSVDTLVARVSRAPKNAPVLVAQAATENPKFVLRIVSATVAAFPDRAAEIVSAVLVVFPQHAVRIVRAAIAAQPDLAIEIASASLQALPDQNDEIMKAALEAAPADLRGAIRSINTGEVEMAYPAASEAARRASFPQQSVRPDLVISPSS